MTNEFPPLPDKKSKVRRVTAKPDTKKDRAKLLKEMEKQTAKKNATIERIQEEIRDEKFLERKALHYLDKKSKIVATDVVENAPPELTDEIRKEAIAFKPNSLFQTAFLAAAEDEVLAGGGRGSGKSLALVADPLAYVDNQNFRAVIIRRTMPELRELIDRAKTMYFQAVPSVQWKVKESMFLFPSGAKIEFGYLDSENDLEKYRGQEYTWIGIDEVSQIPDYTWYYKLKASLRTSDPTLHTYIRCTTNPTGVGIDWVKDYWGIGINPAGKTIREVVQSQIGEIVSTKKWFTSNVFDNVDLLKANPGYVAQLMAAPPHLRKAWLDGDWDAIEGAAFQEFDRSIHVCEPFEIPQNWRKFRGADYGYGDGAACIWIVVKPDGTHYAYREFVCNNKHSERRFTATEFSEKIVEAEVNDAVRYGVLDSSVWANRGDSGPSLAEQMMHAGTRWRPADKSKGSRVAGKNRIHQMLQVNPRTGKPSLIFFNTCPHTIKMMVGIPIDSNNAEDVDTDSPLDHQYDALRYILMSRPFASAYQSATGDNKPIIYNSTFFS